MTTEINTRLARQLGSLFGRLQQGTNSTGNALLAQDSGGSSNNLDPAQALALLQGNSALLESFEKQIEERFSALGDRVLQRWLQTTDSEIRRSVEELSGMVSSLTGASPSAGSFDEILERSTSRLQSLIARTGGALLKQALTRTERSSRESDRSQQESSRFRSSRGQQQAELSRELSQGRRYV